MIKNISNNNQHCINGSLPTQARILHRDHAVKPGNAPHLDDSSPRSRADDPSYESPR